MVDRPRDAGSKGVVPRLLARIRKICLALPEAHEVVAWSEPTWRVKNKMFAMYAAAGNHHGLGRASVWVKGTLDNQSFMVRHDPGRFFVPAYVGVSGWVGVYLDGQVDWEQVADVVRDGYRLVAPRMLLARLDH